MRSRKCVARRLIKSEIRSIKNEDLFEEETSNETYHGNYGLCAYRPVRYGYRTRYNLEFLNTVATVAPRPTRAVEAGTGGDRSAGSPGVARPRTRGAVYPAHWRSCECTVDDRTVLPNEKVVQYAPPQNRRERSLDP